MLIVFFLRLYAARRSLKNCTELTVREMYTLLIPAFEGETEPCHSNKSKEEVEIIAPRAKQLPPLIEPALSGFSFG